MASTHAQVLHGLASRVASVFVEEAGAVAALVVGSTATGTADEWSDIDLILFYGSWPGAAVLEQARQRLAPADLLVLGGDPGGDVYLEQFAVDGVACQLVHQTIDAWRATAATVLHELDVASPAQKALSGLHQGLVLHGGDVIGELRGEAQYPDPLRAAMVRANLDLFPLWMLQDGLAKRDAELWQRGELVSALQKVLAMLAGINRVYFSTFQLKHTRDLVGGFTMAPPDLVDRLEHALVARMPEAAQEMERLVDETLAIVERELPEVDVAAARARIGRRIQPWSPPG